MRRAALLGLALLLLLLAGCFWIPSHSEVSMVGRKILLPLYIYPMWWDPDLYRWDEVAAAVEKAEIWAIINPASGPGGPPNSDYVRGLADLRAAGVTMIGYVYTDYGNRDLATVKAEVDLYAEHFKSHGLVGIFYDGVASSADKLSYYAELARYAKEEKGFSWVFLNPGTTIDEAYLTHGVGDVIVIYEDNYANFLGHTFPEYVARYPASRFAILVWGVPDLAAATEVLRRAARIGFVHCTDDTPPNEWDTLPAFWEDWVELFRQPIYYVP